MIRSNMHLPILCLVFLLSGAAGLLFETLWFRGAGLSFGNSVWAGSITLAAYMSGLALGNALTGRLGRQERNPVRAYAVLKLLIGVTGLLLVPLLPTLASVLASLLGAFDNSLWWSAPLRLATVFLLLMIPTTAMGATLPLLMMALCRKRQASARRWAILTVLIHWGRWLAPWPARFIWCKPLACWAPALSLRH